MIDGTAARPHPWALIPACLSMFFFLSLPVVQAHPLDVAYFDISATPTSTTLTVAVHPYQAFELVRAGEQRSFDLARLSQRADLIAAYVTDHVSVSAPLDSDPKSWKPCLWEADAATVPPTELEAVADGVTIAALLRCDSELPSVIRLEPDLFFDGFPQQSNTVRLEFPDGFADVAKIDAKQRQAEVKLNRSSSSVQSSKPKSAGTSISRRPDADMTDIAKQLLDPGLGFWGFLLLLGSAIIVGALHALGPGHGKSLMAAMLVGENASLSKVLALGTVMTVTHVSDVFLLALFAGFISAFLPPITLIHYLEIASALGLVIFGLWNFFRAYRIYRKARTNPEAVKSDDAHERAHLLGLPHVHGEVEETASFSRALWMGFVGSLAPCPTAWAIFMATLSIGKAAAGVALLVAFTIGLHVTIIMIGFLIITSKRYALRKTPIRFTYALPMISAIVIILLGAYLASRNLGIIG